MVCDGRSAVSNRPILCPSSFSLKISSILASLSFFEEFIGRIGSKNFSDLSELLRNEWELTKDRTLSESEWLDENITFLTEKHQFYTNFALTNWGKSKGKNLAQLLKAKKKLKQENTKFNQ